MRSKLLLSLFCLALLAVASFPQAGTPHGIDTVWSAPTPVGGSGVIQGYFLFRCVGDSTVCTATSTNWTAVGAMLPATPTAYHDPASGLNTNTTYSYAVLTVDSNGNQSAYSNLASAAVGASFPTNPGPPTGCKSKVN